ncbi:uncharacterized protein ACBT44_006587 isoform 7-T7 [Syngnathus typhle]
MAHAAAHIKKARSEMDPPADLKALEKAKERRRRSREQAERRRKSDSNTSFLRAARAGNIDKVLEYLKGGVDINTSNQNGLNALHLAAKEGHVALVEELLEGGVALNSATKKGNTALHISALAGQAEVVKVLVKRGADINGQSQNGFTPLYMAAQENHLEVVRYLLENGGNQSAATEDGFTPLAIALQQGHEQVVSVLLENDTKGKVRLPALHIAARKDDTKSAALLLQSDHNADVRSKMMVNRSTESGFTPLHIAAHYGNVNVATLLLNRGAAVDFLARNAITPLHVASKRGNGAMVCLLLDRGSQIDAKTRDGLTPLHCAARSGHDSAVELLLERGAPLLARTKNGLSPLHMAAQGDHVDCVKQLLRHSAPIGDVTLDYLTALHVAAHCGHFRVTQLLLERRADPDARALNGFTPLHIACKKNRVKVMELLVKYGASVQAVTESGLTPVHVAAFMGHLNIVLLLLQNGASPDRSNIRGETSLHMAVRAGQVEVVRCLLRNGATVDARAREEQTPLHIAARLGKSEIVQLLLQHMAHPDAATANGYTALHIAAKEGQPEIASVLLEAGAERSLPTKAGFTPLHVASKYGSRDVAKLLLQRDALPDSVGKNGLTPLHVATHYDNQKVALLLLDKGASPHAVAKNGYTPLHIAAKKNQVETARALLARGAQSHLLSKQGVTPLHLASEEGHADMAALLLNHGARVNAGTKSGLSALHLAAQDDRLAAAQILATNGADLDQQTKLGYTPLMVACHYGNSKVVNFLLQNGASVTVETKNGYGPLHQAAQQGNTHIIDILLQHGAKPNAVTANGNTALGIARRLGYISVVDTLKVVTEEMVTTTTTTVTEKHKLNVPETMTEVLDVSDEEGDDTITGDGGDYLRAEDLRELGDDSLPGQYPDHANYFGDEGAHAGSWERSFTLQSYQQKLESVTDERLTCQTWWLSRGKMQNSYRLSWGAENLDNLAPHSGPGSPCHDGAADLSSFLVSFMVDARGGSMRGCRYHGLRVLIPPGTCGAPTRVTCRLVKQQRLAQGPALAARRGAELALSGGQLLGKLHLPSAPPPLNEGESLVSRMVQLGPPGTTFLGPVVVEVPHFAALRGGERELVILRSETGESWKEHHCEHTQEELKQILNTADDEEPDSGEEVQKKRICRIIARDLPQFFAVVSRVRQDAALIGPEGGVLSSTVVPQVQARFPEGALTKKIRVGLQAQPVSLDLVRRALGNRSSFSPVVTLEPRRRKFHKAITVTIPVPKGNTSPLPAASSRSAPTLRLLCSITGGTTPAQWEDITGTTPLTFTSDRVSFTTNVSARFWLIDCRQVHESVNFSSRVYRELICVPYMAKFVILAKSHHEPSEGHLRCLCVTDDKLDKTPERRDDFAEVARSRDVEVLEGRPIYADCCGNFVPLAKSGQHHVFSFFAFKENRLALSIKIRDDAREPCGRLCFLKEPPRSYGAALGHDAVCNLNVALPSFRKESDSDPEEEMDNARREQPAAHHRSQAKDVRQTTAPIGPEEAHTNSSKVQKPAAVPPPPPVAAATDDGPSARLNAENRSHEQKVVKSGETAPFPPNVTDRAEAAPEVPTSQTSKPPEFCIYDHAEEEELDCPRTESKGVTAKTECCAFGKVEEVEILDLAVPPAAAGSPSLAAAGSPSLATAGSSSRPGTADTTPEEKTPTEGSTPTSEPNPFLFQEGKLFEMTRSGAIDMTKRSCQEDGGAFAFFQIAQHALEGPVSGNGGREGEAPAGWRDVGLNLTVELKTEERSEQSPDWQLPSITELDHTSAKLKIPKMGLSTCWAKDHRDPESLEAPAHHGDSSCLDLGSTGHATVNAETAESALTRSERGTESSHSSRQDSKSAAEPPDSCGVPLKSPTEPARRVQKQTPGGKSRIPIKSKSPEADSLLRSAQDKRSRGPTNGTAAPSQGTLVKAKTSAGTAWTRPESKAKAFRSRLPVKGKGGPSRKDAGEARRHSEPSLVEVAERPEEDRRRRRRDQSATERHASGIGRRRRSCAGETQARPSPGAGPQSPDGAFVEKESESHRTDTVDTTESGAGASAASPEPKGHNEMEATRGGPAESTRSEQSAAAAAAAGALTPRLPRPTTHAGVPHQKPGA